MTHKAAFTPNPSDALTAYRMHRRLRDDIWKLYLALATGIFLVFGVSALILDFPFLAGVGLFTGAFVFGVPMLGEWNIKRLAKRVHAEEVRYSFSDEGVQFETSRIQVKHTWDIILKATIDERGVLLYTGPMNYSFVPARAFTSGVFPRDGLKAILASKLKNA